MSSDAEILENIGQYTSGLVGETHYVMAYLPRIAFVSMVAGQIGLIQLIINDVVRGGGVSCAVPEIFWNFDPFAFLAS